MYKNIIIKNGLIVDGTAKKGYESDIKITKNKIANISKKIEASKEDKVIDAANKIICPGFIDIHNHADFYLLSEEHPIFLKPFCFQGITTLVCGNCGFSAFPARKNSLKEFKKFNEIIMVDDIEINWESCDDYLKILESKGILFNYIPITGHGALRKTLANGIRKLSDNHLKTIKENLIQTLEEGSFGLSTGLGYSPGCYADTDELIELVNALSKFPNTIYTSHLRGYSETILKSVEEFLEITEKTGVKSEISHFIPFGIKHTTKIKEALNKIINTNKKGFIAQYDDLSHYTGQTTILALIPPWEYEKGIDVFLDNIKKDDYLDRVMNEIMSYIPRWPLWENNYWSDNLIRNSGWQNTYVVGLENNTDLIGLTFLEISEKKNKPISKVLRDLLLEENCNVMIHVVDNVGGDIGDDDTWIDYLIENPLSNIMTDALFQKNYRSRPDAYGGFTKFIRKYVKEKKTISLEDAINKLTKKVADLFGIKNTGVVEKGKYADLVIFDYKKITDNPVGRVPLSYTAEPKLSSGIEYLFINGELIIENNNYIRDKKSGRVIRRQNS